MVRKDDRVCLAPLRKFCTLVGLPADKPYRIAKKTVSERFGPSKKVQEDMLGSFVRHGLTNEEAVSESLFQMYDQPDPTLLSYVLRSCFISLAGSDTTATAIRTVMMFVISSTRVYNTLMAEIDRAEHQGNISSPVVYDAEAKKLPYLQACIKESLRLMPPITGISLKEVPLGGDIIHGYSLPSGTRVGLAQWAMQRKKNVFGADADVFRPERWLDANVSSERHLMMKRSTDLIFATGRYACLGRSVAFTELNKVLVEASATSEPNINGMLTLVSASYSEDSNFPLSIPRGRGSVRTRSFG